MTKKEFLKLIAIEAEISQKKANKVFEKVIDTIVETAKKEGKVIVTGLGIFKVVKQKARTARNPKTGEEIKVPAKNVLRFKPAKSVKERVK